MTPGLAAVVLAAFEKADNYESLMWRVTHAPCHEADVKLLALCSDFFYLATADCEEIEAGDIALLEQCLTDLTGSGEEFCLAELFAARKRKMRPHRSAYKGMPPAVAALFDACSTEEERAGIDQRERAFWTGVAKADRPGPEAS